MTIVAAVGFWMAVGWAAGFLPGSRVGRNEHPRWPYRTYQSDRTSHEHDHEVHKTEPPE